MVTTIQATANAAAMSLVEKLIGDAFHVARQPRSDAYKLGARELLKCRALGQPLICPHVAGTAYFDAFYAGCEEGKAIWQKHLDSEAGHGNR